MNSLAVVMLTCASSAIALSLKGVGEDNGTEDTCMEHFDDQAFCDEKKAIWEEEKFSDHWEANDGKIMCEYYGECSCMIEPVDEEGCLKKFNEDFHSFNDGIAVYNRCVKTQG
jgi:hypothetical protein